MWRTSFTWAEEFFGLVINLSHLRGVLRGSVLGPWRLRDTMSVSLYWRSRSKGKGTAEESETAGESETVMESETAAAVRRLIKGSRLSVKCVRGRRVGGMRRLICGCDLKQLFLCGALKMDPRSFPSRPAALFMLPVSVFRGPQRRRATPFPGREGKSMPAPLSITSAKE